MLNFKHATRRLNFLKCGTLLQGFNSGSYKTTGKTNGRCCPSYQSIHKGYQAKFLLPDISCRKYAAALRTLKTAL